MKKTHVSAVIPNYNGLNLLQENLPSVLATLRNEDELIIVDDASPDESVAWLRSFFHAEYASTYFRSHVYRGQWQKGSKKIDVKILQHSRNTRYARSCNDGVDLAQHRLIFLINSDVRPKLKTVDTLMQHFSDDTVFAVGCLELEPETEAGIGPETGKGTSVKTASETGTGKETETETAAENAVGTGTTRGANSSVEAPPKMTGKNQLWFARGMFMHAKAHDFSSGETAWVDGGSGMYDRNKWLEIAGYDLDFRPAYWEDIDLSFRARQKGWKILFDEHAVVEHRHESTNASAFGLVKMKTMSWQNGQKFFQKHASLRQRVAHWIWQPYWWVRAANFYWFGWALLGIILLAAVLRLYQLGSVPHGMTWDEAAIGYNGYAVLTTRRDEWLTRLPLSFRSFGDYKAPLAIYVNGPFTYLWGMQLWVVRFPFALAGILAIPAFGLLVKELVEWIFADDLHEHWGEAELLGLAAAALLTFSPWHHFFSRVGFESGMALSFFLWGAWALLRACHRPLINVPTSIHFFRQICFLLFAATMLVASMYTYHSAKIVVPVLAGMFLLTGIGKKWKELWYLLLMLAGICAVLLVPLLQDTLYGSGSERFSQASIFAQVHGVDAVRLFFEQLVVHFSPQFLFFGQTGTLRHGDGHWGVLLLTEGLFLLLAIIGLFSMGWSSMLHNKKVSRSFLVILLSLAWSIVGFVPAAIGVDVPHANRGLFALPGILLAGILGARWWYGKLNSSSINAQWLGTKKETRLAAKSFFGTCVLLHMILVLAYTRDYYRTFAGASTTDFMDGYLDAFAVAKQYEPTVDKILFSNVYGQPYIYALFSRRTNPIWYRGGSLNTYEFTGNITRGDVDRPKTLVVATPGQIPRELADKVVYGADGSIRFLIVYPKGTP
jgi:GT2 family glycosyltransferase/4-amino-4-deoxy-L-arabinose transferase-like glycosyltransferase